MLFLLLGVSWTSFVDLVRTYLERHVRRERRLRVVLNISARAAVNTQVILPQLYLLGIDQTDE